MGSGGKKGGRKTGGLVGNQFVFLALRDIPSPCEAISASLEGLQQAELRCFSGGFPLSTRCVSPCQEVLCG